MQEKQARQCRNFGETPECQKVADDRYTMDFSDVAAPDDGMLYWCAHCGPIEHRMVSLIALALSGPDADAFRNALAAAVGEVESRIEREGS